MKARWALDFRSFLQRNQNLTRLIFWQFGEPIIRLATGATKLAGEGIFSCENRPELSGKVHRFGVCF
jgi:hypothetical protein